MPNNILLLEMLVPEILMSAKRWSGGGGGGGGRVDANSYYKWINIRIRKKANISSSILRANTEKEHTM